MLTNAVRQFGWGSDGLASRSSSAGWEALTLHLPEQMREAAADLELLRVVFEGHQLAAPQVAHHAGHRPHVHDRGAVNLPEQRRVELLGQLPDRNPDQRFVSLRLNARVFLVGHEKQDLADRNHPQLLTNRGPYPFQRPR